MAGKTHNANPVWGIETMDGFKQIDLPLDGLCSGPLFAPLNKVRAPTRPKGKEGVVHRKQTQRATPAWAEQDAIRRLYQWARIKSAITGELWVVDHIVPKISPYVCGLHVIANLRVIHWRENTSKANLWWPDMPEAQVEMEFL